MKTLAAVLLILACTITMAQAQAPMSLPQLVEKSDFIGFVQANADMIGKDPHAEWRQEVFLSGTDSIKGTLLRSFGNDQYPYIKADHAAFAGYPTQFGEPGEYLIFLQVSGKGHTAQWTTLAAYHVQYYPDGLGNLLTLQQGHVIGLVSSRPFAANLLNGTQNGTLTSRPAVTAAEARQYLSGLVSHAAPQADEVRVSTLFRASLQSQADSLRNIAPTHEERLALAQKLAAAITPGMTRAEVEKVFPQSDGGAFGSDAWRYYFGSEVMVGVPYDTTGGPFQPENRVNGPLRVYRDMMHLD